MLQLNVSSALCVSVKQPQPSRSWSEASRLVSALTGINVAMLCYTVLSSLNPKVVQAEGFL